MNLGIDAIESRDSPIVTEPRSKGPEHPGTDSVHTCSKYMANTPRLVGSTVTTDITNSGRCLLKNKLSDPTSVIIGVAQLGDSHSQPGRFRFEFSGSC